MTESTLTAVVQGAYRATHPFGRGSSAGRGHERYPNQPARCRDRRLEKGLPCLDQPIDGNLPYLSIDAPYRKARQNGLAVSVGVIAAACVNSVGLLGLSRPSIFSKK